MKQSTLILLFAAAALFFTTAPAPAQTVNFDQFLQQFPAATLPFRISTETLQAELTNKETTKATRLDWAYFEFLPELESSAQFSRMPVYPEPVARFETKSFHAVLYNLARGLSKGSKYYTISVFDKEGNHIGTHYIGGVTGKQLNAFTINEELLATVNGFDVIWKANVNEAGFEGNNILNLTPKSNQSIKLNTPGNPNELGFNQAKSNYRSTTSSESAPADMK
jgi:hypothetical protein